MSRYTSHTPMDFEFQNGTGPMDARSPFANVSANPQRYPPGMSSPSKNSEHVREKMKRGPELMDLDVEQRSVFDASPSKSRQQSSPTKPLPPTPAFKNGLFNTPRKPSQDFDDSSAGETPKSPESDATPEVKKTRGTRGALIRLEEESQTQGATERHNPVKERPEPQRSDSSMRKWFAQVKNKVYSPGRGEIVARKDHSGALEKSARRRKREVDHRVARKRRRSLSDSGEDTASTTSRKASGRSLDSQNQPHWASTFFSFIAQHPTLPNTLSQYAQFIFNMFWLTLLAYIIYSFWAVVRSDVDRKSEVYMIDIISEKISCAKQYNANNCDPVSRPPALEIQCSEWDKCRNRDERKVARGMVSARTFAEIFNSFVEEISYKAMAFSCILIFGCFAISNFAFGFFRHKMMQEMPPSYEYGYGAPPPPTPQRAFSGQDAAFYTAGTPWHQPPPGAAFEPQPSRGFGQIDGKGSPVRRLAFH